MKLRFMVPARDAFLESDRAGTVVGTIDCYRGEQFPLRCTFHLLMSFEAEIEDAGAVLTPHVEVYSPDGEVLGQRQVHLEPGPLGVHGEPWLGYAALKVAFTARSPGEHEIQCRLGEDVLGCVGLPVLRESA